MGGREELKRNCPRASHHTVDLQKALPKLLFLEIGIQTLHLWYYKQTQDILFLYTSHHIISNRNDLV